MNILIYPALAIAFLILAIKYLRKPMSGEPEETHPEKRRAPSMGDGHWLDLSERIFDPSDARWLAEELAFPKLAAALEIERKRLAIRWLETLRSSFEDFVRTPDLELGDAAEASSVESLRMLWMTMRFKFLIFYALCVVRAVGPYHRLIPSFSWVPSSRQPSFRNVALAENRSSR